MYFEEKCADYYYGFVSNHVRIDHDNFSRGRTRAHAHARTRANHKEKLDGRKIRTKLLYRTAPYAKYRSESIKYMVRTCKELGRANEVCDRTERYGTVRYGTVR